MEEKQITIDGETRPLGSPFYVIATQNPVESSGTFALPEAQLDRFLVRLTLGYPSTSESVDILKNYIDGFSAGYAGRCCHRRGNYRNSECNYRCYRIGSHPQLYGRLG